ncbi:MAG: biotin transporter BioY [Cyanobacteria bacterium SIG28]|nr:biotin transporter BioY [Cyanobacteria bacterium SIG28]
MTKRLSKQINSFKYKGEPIKITIGTLLLTCLSVLFLIIATFTQITFTHPIIPSDALTFLSQEPTDYEIANHFSKTYRYIPQIPVIFFIVALLGRKFGILAICMYIILGMFFPIFALGGGVSYLFEYGFGYILAFVPAIFFSGTLLKVKSDFFRIVLLATLGVCAIHILGVLYMLFIATLRHAPMDLIYSWISSQSGIQILYDIFFSIIAVYIGRTARKFLWIVMC